jgi:hypothetical protein
MSAPRPMGTATCVGRPTGFNGEAWVFDLSEPLQDYDGTPYSRVIVSVTMLEYGVYECETYIFGLADHHVHWGELPGSVKGTVSHATALAAAGYHWDGTTTDTVIVVVI